jgi:hypothetical protein
LTVPRTRIAGIEPTPPGFGKENLKLTLLGTPARWIAFSESVSVRGMYGGRRRARAVGLEPDEPSEFALALRPAGPEEMP